MQVVAPVKEKVVFLLMNTGKNDEKDVCFCRRLKEGETDASRVFLFLFLGCGGVFLLPRRKQGAGSYKDSIIKSTKNN